MVCRQLTEERYQAFCEELAPVSEPYPPSPVCEVSILFNGGKYLLYLLPDGENRICALYALRVRYEERTQEVLYDLITEGPVLLALLELILYQGIRAVPHSYHI